MVHTEALYDETVVVYRNSADQMLPTTLNRRYHSLGITSPKLLSTANVCCESNIPWDLIFVNDQSSNPPPTVLENDSESIIARRFSD